jgi:hypothetical protein
VAGGGSASEEALEGRVSLAEMSLRVARHRAVCALAGPVYIGRAVCPDTRGLGKDYERTGGGGP